MPNEVGLFCRRLQAFTCLRSPLHLPRVDFFTSFGHTTSGRIVLPELDKHMDKIEGRVSASDKLEDQPPTFYISVEAGGREVTTQLVSVELSVGDTVEVDKSGLVYVGGRNVTLVAEPLVMHLSYKDHDIGSPAEDESGSPAEDEMDSQESLRRRALAEVEEQQKRLVADEASRQRSYEAALDNTIQGIIETAITQLEDILDIKTTPSDWKIRNKPHWSELTRPHQDPEAYIDIMGVEIHTNQWQNHALYVSSVHQELTLYWFGEALRRREEREGR